MEREMEGETAEHKGEGEESREWSRNTMSRACEVLLSVR
jgi:hypothetical protein